MWLSGGFFSNGYESISQLSSDGSTVEALKNSSKLTATRAACGLGTRFISNSDHTFSIFPTAGYGVMSWKTFNSNSSTYDVALADLKLQGLLYGVAIEYQSPERSSLAFRIRAEMQVQPSLTSYGIKNDISLRLPSSVDIFSKAAGGTTSSLVSFLDVAQLVIKNSPKDSSSSQNVKISIIDAAIGLGLRVEWR
jgi:hypothetical protein